MGVNKALLRLEPGGSTLIEKVIAALQPIVSQPLLITNTPEIYQWLGLPIVSDNYSYAGPLAGIEAGLQASPAEYNLVVGCDMPYLQTKLLQYLVVHAQANSSVLAVIPLNPQGVAEPLCAVYSKKALATIQRRLQLGQYKPLDLADEIEVAFLTAPQLQAYDPALCSFVNLNTPADLPPSFQAS